MAQDDIRFGVLVSTNAPFPTLIDRWKSVEKLGFDCLWIPDHTADFNNPEGPWLDGWISLAAATSHTESIRVGTLVSNPILRHPVILAKQAASVDHLSGGRLELGIGTGIAKFDHQAVGSAYWSHQERVARFREYVEIVDRVLQSDGETVTVSGRYYSTEDSRLVPRPAQRPRPPITIGGQSAAVLGVAATCADVWNSDGHPQHSVDEVYESTRRQNEQLDKLCTEAGRDPMSLRRSLLLLHRLSAWASPESLSRHVERFWPIGVREFVLSWPGDDRRHDIERVASEVLPQLRRDLKATPA
jgi:alkanesulfonate monooxygenase SsuD/methylene tetrahydromethanopterin reductase-like flavin-dependent oxidoreductase (luciferase family)